MLSRLRQELRAESQASAGDVLIIHRLNWCRLTVPSLTKPYCPTAFFSKIGLSLLPSATPSSHPSDFAALSRRPCSPKPHEAQDLLADSRTADYTLGSIAQVDGSPTNVKTIRARAESLVWRPPHATSVLGFRNKAQPCTHASGSMQATVPCAGVSITRMT